MELSRKKTTRYHQIVLVFILLCGCSFQESGRSAKSSKISPEKSIDFIHDPYSAPLKEFGSTIAAPDFTVHLLSGIPFEQKNQEGKIVILNIWATWCAPCLKETPDLIDIYSQYGADNVEILGVSIDKQGIDVVQPFVNKFDIPYPIAIDSDGIIEQLYGPVMGIPSTFIIDQEGILKFHAVGAVTKRELKLRIESLLNNS